MAEGGLTSKPTAEVRVTKTVVTQILGSVRAENADVQGRAAENSTRWVLDVETDSTEHPGAAYAIVLFLLNPWNEKMVYQPDIFSCSFTPLNEAFYAATPYVEHRSDGAFVLRARTTQGVTRFRLGIDTIHSAAR